MKNKIILLVSLVALITLSFTFATGEKPKNVETQVASTGTTAPVGGILSAEVVR